MGALSVAWASQRLTGPPRLYQLFVGQSSCSPVWQHQQCAKAFLCRLPPMYRGSGLRLCCHQVGCKERRHI